jgi:hypothetical protein
VITDELCRSYLDVRWHFDPAAASAAGETRLDGRLGSYDAASVREHLAALRAIAVGAEDLEVEALEDEIDRTALLSDVRTAIAVLEDERPHVRNPEFWLTHLFQALYSLLARPGGTPASRAPAALERLEAAPAFLDQARATVVKPPLVFVETARTMLGGGGELVSATVGAFAAAAPELAERLGVAGEATLRALARFGVALRDEIEPDPSPRAFALGEDLFNHRLHETHALRATAPELWRYALHLIEEVEAELEQVAAEIDPGAEWRDVIERLRDDTPPPDGVLDFYAAEVARARDFVADRGLAVVPEAPCAVVPTPSFLRPLIPFAAYDPPPVLLPERLGRFYVTEPDPALPADARAALLREHCVHEVPSTVVHEAYPGHHLQLVTAQALRSEVRRHLWTPIFVEGWALYCESLMAEEGYHTGPEARLFHLVNLLWRAVRIRLDIGLHTRDMTPAEAVDELVARLPMERRSAEAEVRRYCAMPTYQLSYAVGRRELLALRADFRERAGPEYSLGAFHEAVLAYGGMPPALIRWGLGLGV